MSAAKLRIGIIGAGSAGGRHAAALRKLANVQLVAVSEPDAARGAALALESGAQHFAQSDGTFWDAIDAVIISAPHALLAEITLQAIAAGKAVLVEKPVAITLIDIDRIEAAARAANVPVMVGFGHRFRADVVAAREAIQHGLLGEPTFAVEHLVSGGGATPGWIWTKAMGGGGVTLFNGVHGLDRLRWLLQRDVVQVFAHTATRSRVADVEDITVATLIFEGGISASFVQHIAPYSLPSGWRSEVYGTQGAVLFGADGSLTLTSQHRTTTMKTDRDDRFLHQAMEFVAAIQEGRAPSVDIADGRAALQTALAIYRSAELGRVVNMSEIVP